MITSTCRLCFSCTVEFNRRTMSTQNSLGSVDFCRFLCVFSLFSCVQRFAPFLKILLIVICTVDDEIHKSFAISQWEIANTWTLTAPDRKKMDICLSKLGVCKEKKVAIVLRHSLVVNILDFRLQMFSSWALKDLLKVLVRIWME